jgi:hypothetical protein
VKTQCCWLWSSTGTWSEFEVTESWVIEIEGGFQGGKGDGPESRGIGQQHRNFTRCHWHRDGVGPWTRFEANTSRGGRDQGGFWGGKGRWARMIENKPTTLRCCWHRDGVGLWIRFEENASWGSRD